MDDIFIGNGVSEVVNMAMTAFLNPGDEILIHLQVIHFGRIWRILSERCRCSIAVMSFLNGILMWSIFVKDHT